MTCHVQCTHAQTALLLGQADASRLKARTFAVVARSVSTRLWKLCPAMSMVKRETC